MWGTRWSSLLSHCATRRAVAGSITDGVTGSGVDSVCNTNEYKGYLLGRKGGRCLRLRALQPSCVLIFLEPQIPAALTGLAKHV